MSTRPLNPMFWILAQVGHRARVATPSAKYLRADAPGVSDYYTVHVPTRHGVTRCLVYRPEGVGRDAPVVMHMHGGGFVNRYPEQDVRYAGVIAMDLRAVVILPDYDAGPTVQYPVAEEQMIDVAEWITASGKEHGWDGARLALSGISAGAKFAINICQYRAAHGLTPPRAVALVVPVTDVVRTDRTSRNRRAAISPFIQRFVQWAYMPDPTRRSEPMASPRYDPALAGSMPPTIIQTGELDTLAAEGRELARSLADHGVEVNLHQVPGGDHSMYATREVLGVLNRIRVFFAHRV